MDVLAVIAAVVSLAVPHRVNATPTVAADQAFVVVAWTAADAGGATDVFEHGSPCRWRSEQAVR